jgi:predicted cation transporter
VAAIVYLIVFVVLAFLAAKDAKRRIAAGATPREVGGHPVSVFFVVLVIGGLFYLYKRNKDYGPRPS